MTAPPLAVQLYTFRDALAEDAPAAIARVAEMGFVGVELVCSASMRDEISRAAPAWTLDAVGMRGLLDEHGLVVCGAHTGLPEGAKATTLFDEQEQLRNDLLIVPALSVLADARNGDLDEPDALRRIADRFNEAAALAAERGMRIGYHNHFWEWTSHPDGRLAYDVFWDALDPSIVAEVDLYWAQVGGQDPARVVAQLGQRAQLVHVKDGPLVRDAPNTPVGAGKLDTAGVLAASVDACWHVVELDASTIDPFDAVAQSVDWLVGRGLSSCRRDGELVTA